ncbi:protein-cysteine N-palmitoyltransferase HHAT-like [Gigantopelta aegis]|uniref:protein-cysteine N-palmitoyltransferase HHAT-like n=1 Tax=Gigantopelta aegis TaxID=1735272 RepID=UPI001B889487|nr:protein-cysteine N-palmitoyltransferase HHAT-like [Gigantopelta aegis]
MTHGGRTNECQITQKKSHVRAGPSKIHYGCLAVPEISLYSLIGFGSISYVLYSIFRDSDVYQDYLNAYDFEDGWKILGRRKDISNFEWTFWYRYFWQLVPWYSGHIVISKLLEFEFKDARKHVFLTYSLVCVSFVLGWRVVLFFIGHCCSIFLVSSLKSSVAVWITSLSLLATLNYEYFLPFMKWLCAIQEDTQERAVYLFLFELALVNLRYTSFCLEKCKSSSSLKKTPDCYGMLDMLLYVFYIPLFFTGPLLTYDKFVIQINNCQQKWTLEKLYPILRDFVRVLFWAVFIEFILHYMYFNALMQNVHLLKSISVWTLVGIGYSQGQFFMVKYLVMYGLPSQIARLDHIDPPKWPKCISYIIRYSDMWKYFDRGLYSFLKRYIYIPFGGSQAGMLKRLAGSLTCFVYIYFWHGAEFHLLLWSIFNFLGSAVELFAAWLEQTKPIVKLETELLSPASVRRLHATLVVPLFLLSAFAIFFFFGGEEVGSIFFERLVTKASFPSLVVFYFLMYCSMQNAMEVEQRLKVKRD